MRRTLHCDSKQDYLTDARRCIHCLEFAIKLYYRIMTGVSNKRPGDHNGPRKVSNPAPLDGFEKSEEHKFCIFISCAAFPADRDLTNAIPNY